MSSSINKTKIILASQSPRRRKLLSLMIRNFTVKPAKIDESISSIESAKYHASRLAKNKSHKIANHVDQEDIVIGADTIVTYENTILGKPSNKHEAFQMLKTLNGKTHKVITALSIHTHKSKTIIDTCCETNVQIRNMSDEEINSYIDTNDPMDKAGSYSIQNKTFKLGHTPNGCLANVIGLPLCHLANTFNKLDTKIDNSIAEKCQSYINYDCPVSESILKQ